MDSILYPFLAALSIMGLSLVGVIFTAGELGRWLKRNLTYLATFAGGVFILVAWHLAEEAVREGGWIVGVGAVLFGALLMESINFFFPAHHHHDVAHDHTHTQIDGRRVLASDALHNIGDGILLLAAFSADFYIGVAAAIGVLLHEFVQEMSEFFVLRESGYSTRRALTLNFTVSASILVGLFLAAFLSSSVILTSILAGIAAGGFLSVLLHDLLPHALASIKTHGRAYVHVLSLLVGAGAMFSVQALMPDGAIEEDVADPTPVEETASVVNNDAQTPDDAVKPQDPVPSDPAPAGTSGTSAIEVGTTSAPQTPGTRN